MTQSEWEGERPHSHISRVQQTEETNTSVPLWNENASKCHQCALNSHQENPKHGGLKAAATSTLQRTAALHSGTVFHWSSRKPGKAGGFVAGQRLGSNALTPLQSRAQNLVLGQLWFHFSPLVRGSWGCFLNSGVAVFWTRNLIIFFFKKV